VICPDANAKIFVTAAPEIRARRRAAEMRAAGSIIDDREVLADILRRDERDSHRAVAPLIAAGDAVTLDTTDLDIEGAVKAAIAIVDAAR
jgi:cytidylate kinase